MTKPRSTELAGDRVYEGAGDRAPAAVFAVVAVPLLVIYLATATFTLPYNIDAFTNVLTAWEIAQDGSPFLDEQAELADPLYTGNIGWVQAGSDGPIAQYPPGAALHAVPLYIVWPEDPQLKTLTGWNRPAPPVETLVPPLAPAAITSSLVVAAAMGILALAFRQLTSDRVAVTAALVMGLGTSAWAVAADQLWQHGPGMLWIAVGGLLSQGRPWLGGGAYGMAILVRPPTAVIAAANGLVQGITRKSAKPVLAIGLTSAIGLTAVVAYNAWVFGDASITGGYGSGFTDDVLDADIGRYLSNIARALVDPTRGLLIWSPWLVPLFLGIPAAWRRAPSWVRGSAIGGLAYLLLQLKANRFSGGAGFATYRYPLEALAAAAPLLLLAYREWVQRNWLATRAFVFLAAGSVAAQAVFAVAT